VFAWRGQYPGAALGNLGKTPRGPLSDLRLGVKDLFHIAGLPTGAGNPDWLRTHPIPDKTSPVVAQLLNAGAQLIGKTQTDELAYSLNGLNQHYGAPINPRAPARLPGGSSSGSAVAVALGEIDIGLGTDTGGSIRVPASYSGLFGMRTSQGLISTEQMVPLAPRFDTVGWLTRDAGLLQRVGELLLPVSPQISALARRYRLGLLQPEIGGIQLWTRVHQHWLQRSLLQHPQLQLMKTLKLDNPWLTVASDCFRVLQGRAIWRSHGAWIRDNNPQFAPDIDARLRWCASLNAAQERAAEHRRAQLLTDIGHWFAQVDVLLLPTTPGPAPRLDASSAWLDSYRQQLLGLTAPAGLAGLPQVHLPVLEEDGAPMGISLLGPPGTDRDLLQLAVLLTGQNKEVNNEC